MALGTYYFGANPSAGASCELDDLRIYKTALTAAQVQSIYTAQGMPGMGMIYNALGSVKTTLTGTPLFSQLDTEATSSAVGAFSLRSVNGGTAKAVAVQAHPVVQWPPVPMTSNTTVVSGQLYGNGTYVTKSSNGYINMATSTTQAEFRAFDYTTSSYWEENYILGGSYSVNTGDLLFPTQYETTVSGATAQGNWLQIQLPSAMTLRNYTIVPRSTFEYRSPSTFWIAGSTDGTTWSNVHFQSGIIGYANPDGRSFTVPITSNSVPYSYYRLIVNKTVPSSGGGTAILNIVSLNLFGDSTSYAPSAAQDFYADRLGNLLTAPVTGQTLVRWLSGSTGYVTTWYDQSGLGNHATQATAANQPIIARATKGQGYSCYFNGINSQVLSCAAGTYSLLNGTKYAVCVTERRNNSGTQGGYFGIGSTSGAGAGLIIGYFNNDTTMEYSHRGDNLDNTVASFAGASEPIRYTVFDYSTSTTKRVYINASILPVTNTSYDLTATSGAMTIGKSFATGNATYYYGEMYEVIVFTKSLYDLDGTSTITQIYNNQVGAYGT